MLQYSCWNIFGFEIARCRGSDLQRHFMSQFAELVRASHEISLAVDFHYHTYTSTAMRIELHDALGSFAISAFGGSCHAFFTQPIHSFLKVTICFSERFAAIQDTGIGRSAQLFDHFGRDFHLYYPYLTSNNYSVSVLSDVSFSETSLFSALASMTVGNSFSVFSAAGTSVTSSRAALSFARVDSPRSALSSSSSSTSTTFGIRRVDFSDRACASSTGFSSPSSSLRTALPSRTASATLATNSLIARMASSLEGIT